MLDAMQRTCGVTTSGGKSLQSITVERSDQIVVKLHRNHTSKETLKDARTKHSYLGAKLNELLDLYIWKYREKDKMWNAEFNSYWRGTRGF